MNRQDRYDLFCELLTRHQTQLRGYLLALVRNRADADDLFQTTSLTLWRKFETFEAGSNFFAWARKTAEFVVCNFWRTNRSRFHPLSEAFLDTLAATEPLVDADSADSYLAGLRHCVDKLRPADRDLLDLRYADDMSVQQIAERVTRSRQSVGKSLLRIRRELLHCIQTQMLQEEHP